MSTHSLGHQSSGLCFTTSLWGKPKTHGKGRRMEKTHFHLGEDESSSLQVSHKTRSKLERKILKTYYSIMKIIIMCLPTTSSLSGPLGGIVLLHGTIRRSVDCSFHSLFYPLPSGLRILEQRAKSILSVNRQRFLAMLMLQLLRSFKPLCSFLHLSVHASTKPSNT
ncbi:hypothetical protein H5410_036311 [Solanum commersonii]|uniref:Uncharacterized protein n=1 Tax=Solanum commersonii TaxID=4109 RepID=A0A9J5Y598_SOLCO|nr:hypothetical protein H5410_036311 [Solanum commersonii]